MSSDSLLLASPPVLVTLFTGLLIAFAVQLLMTTFGIAAGITALGYLPGAQPDLTDPDTTDSDTTDLDTTDPEEVTKPSSTGTVGKIGFAIGAGTLLTVNAVLFTACFLAVKLSIVNSVTLGAVLGVVIWSGYFLVLTWLSSKAAGSLLGALVGAFSSGMQGLMATVTTALRRNKGQRQQHEALPDALSKRMAATESSVATMQDQLDAKQQGLENTLRTYMQTLQPPKPDLQSIRQEVAAVLAHAGLPSVAKKAGLSRIDRQALVDLVSSRTDFSKRDIREVVDQLESVWQEVVEAPDTIADITTFFQSASPETLTPETVSARLQQLLTTAQPQDATEQPTAQAIVSPLEPKQLLKQLIQTVRDRVDLSDLDVGSILQQLQTFTQSFDTQPSDRQPSEPSADHDRSDDPFPATIKADVEAYLLNAYPWNLTRKTVQAEFKDVLYDPDANPVAVRNQLLTLDRAFLVALLEQRDDLSPAKVHKIVDRLQTVQEEVLRTLDAQIAEAPSQAFITQVDACLQAAKKAELQSAPFEQQLQTSLEHASVEVEHWSDRLQALSRVKLVGMLNKRPDLSQEEVDALTTQLESARDRLLVDIHTRQAHTQTEALALWQKLEDYVSDRSQKLTARTIQRQLKTLTKAAKAELSSLQKHLPSFDRAAAEQWLRDRQDLSEKQTQRLLSQLEKAWNSLRDLPEAAQDAATGDNPVVTLLTNYIQHLDPATFSIANLPQDLLNEFKQHQVDSDWLGQLTAIDWKPLLEQVQHRQDLTAEQQQQLQQQLQRSLYVIGKFPRRLALRSKQQAQTWQDLLLDYLRHAERDELSLDRLPHALQRLLTPALAASGASAAWLEAQLPALSRNGLTTLLAERGDMTEADITQIVEQVETIVQKAIAQAQALQEQAQAAIATTFEQLRHYIKALPLPALDYDRIKHDLQQVFVDPSLGLESLGSSLGDTVREQLSTLNRETLATLLSTRDDISDAFAQQVTDRIDTVRLNTLAQIETIQQGAQRRLEDLKQQTRQQAEETRKAVAIAAWWLFVTALSSAFTSAIAGALAVGGIAWVEQIAGWSQ